MMIPISRRWELAWEKDVKMGGCIVGTITSFICSAVGDLAASQKWLFG